MNICGLILAAGGSSRLGRPKQLVRVQEKPLLELAIENAVKARLQQVYVVLGARYDQIAPSARHLPVSIIRNEQWQEGIGSSISTGINAISRVGSCDAVLIMLCDQLHVHPQHLLRLIDAYRRKKASIIATTYGGQTGVPALFDQAFFPELEQLSGDTGAKKILHQHAGRLHSIRFEQALIDIDTPEDLHKHGLT